MTGGGDVAAQAGRYVLAAGISTLLNAGIFLVLRGGLEAVPANLVALVLSTAVSTEIHRRFTFPTTDAPGWRAHAQTGATILFYAFYSSAVLVVLHAIAAAPTPVLESASVAAASVFGGTCRFLLLRHWVFDPAAAPVFDPAAAPVSDPAAAPVSDPAAASVFDPAAAPVSDPQGREPPAGPAPAEPGSPDRGVAVGSLR